MKVNLIAATLIAGTIGTATSAATMKYTFDFAGDLTDQPFVVFESNEDPSVTVTVTAKYYTLSGNTFVGGADADVETNSWGLISDNYRGDTHYVDSWVYNEAMIFTFSEGFDVSVTDINIGSWHYSADYRGYDLFVDNQLVGNTFLDGNLLDSALSNSFAVGARTLFSSVSYECGSWKHHWNGQKWKKIYVSKTCTKTDELNTGFKLRSLTVDYEVPAVPLPAGGLLLLSGIAGLGLISRRRKTVA